METQTAALVPMFEAIRALAREAPAWDVAAGKVQADPRWDAMQTATNDLNAAEDARMPLVAAYVDAYRAQVAAGAQVYQN